MMGQSQVVAVLYLSSIVELKIFIEKIFWIATAIPI